MVINRHRRHSRRILRKAHAVSIADVRGGAGAGFANVFAPSQWLTRRNMYTASICVSAVLVCLTLVLLSFLPGSIQLYEVPKCDHLCDDTCIVTPLEQERFANTIFSSIFRTGSGEETPVGSFVSGEVIINNSTLDGRDCCDSVGECDHVLIGDEMTPLADNFDQDSDQGEIGHDENGASDVAGLHTDVEDNDENAGSDDYIPAEDDAPVSVIDITDYTYPDDVYLQFNMDIPYEMWSTVSRSETGFTLTIVVEGEEGMAVISQNGNVLQGNPMKSENTYVVRRILEGDMFIIAANPYNEYFTISWSAFFTEDSEQRFPLASGSSDLTASVKTFIMFEADVTIVIEFVNTNL